MSVFPREEEYIFDKYGTEWQNVVVYQIYKNEKEQKVIRFRAKTWYEYLEGEKKFYYTCFGNSFYGNSCEMLLDNYCAFDKYSNYRSLMKEYTSSPVHCTPSRAYRQINLFIVKNCPDIQQLNVLKVERDTPEGFYYSS